MKVEQTESSKTLAYKVQMPWNYPEESIQHQLCSYGVSEDQRVCVRVLQYNLYCCAATRPHIQADPPIRTVTELQIPMQGQDIIFT